MYDKAQHVPRMTTAFDRARPFIRAGLAGALGWTVIHPFDVIKVRMQLLPRSQPNRFKTVTASAAKRPLSLYSGLSASLTRQLTYTTMRLGLFTTITEGRSLTFAERLGTGFMVGGVASFTSNPIEVAMVRMYADGEKKGGGRGYRHVGHALLTIAREEGLRGLWRGSSATVGRSVIVNAVQLGVYDQAKEGFGKMEIFGQGVGLHLVSSLTSGFCYSAASLPLDVAKTFLQNQKPLPDGTLEYRNLIQAMVRVARREGVSALWKGFWPYFGRCGGHTVSMFLFAEQLRKIL